MNSIGMLFYQTYDYHKLLLPLYKTEEKLTNMLLDDHKL